MVLGMAASGISLTLSWQRLTELQILSGELANVMSNLWSRRALTKTNILGVAVPGRPAGRLSVTLAAIRFTSSITVESSFVRAAPFGRAGLLLVRPTETVGPWCNTAIFLV